MSLNKRHSDMATPRDHAANWAALISTFAACFLLGCQIGTLL